MKNGQQRIAKVLCVLLDGAFMVAADLLGLAVRFSCWCLRRAWRCARSWTILCPRLLVLGLLMSEALEIWKRGI